MRIWVIAVFFLLLPLAYAQEEYRNYHDINVSLRMESTLDLDSGINYLSSELSLFPRETEFQDIIRKEYSKNVLERENSILYEWNDLPEDLAFSLDYDIKSEFNMVNIKSKIPFPIEVPSEYEEYLEDTPLINSDSIIIREKADEIIGDEDDLYEVVYKLGSWANENINYSLETLTEELTQNSLWVLQNRKGVCDELTVLFIAMLRSQGIPAKFVSGSSYTNVIPGFGNHAWAEVYFPGKGWVPFDVTYGQYGYVDSTHIKMKESSMAKEPSVSYRWSSGEKNINVNPLNISAEVISLGDKLPNYIDVSLNVLKDNVKSGSYLPLEIGLENTRDFYLSTTLYITKAPMEVSDNFKSVLLKPNEKKNVYWIIKVPENLDDQYLYTSKIEILDFFGDISESDVEYANKYTYYSLEESQEKVYQLELENRNSESSIDLFCSPDKARYYSYENATLVCRISNDERKSYQFDVCFMEDCRNIIINPDEKKEVMFGIRLQEGNYEYHARMSDNELVKSSYFDVNVIKTPKLNINNIDYPPIIGYRDSAELKFDLSTESPAKNLMIKINDQELFAFDTYVGSENFVVPFNGKYFYGKDSGLIFEYEDSNGKKYDQKQDIIIKITDVPFYVRIGYWWFLIAALIISLFLFRRKFFRLKEPPMPMKKKISKI